MMKDSLKHQNSESYYLSGEQFRSALYFNDSLIIEYYFYKNGDTIFDYPKVDPTKVYQISLKQLDKTIRFKVLDFKVLRDTYMETLK